MSIRGFSFIALMRLLLSLFAGMHYCGAYVRPIARVNIRGGFGFKSIAYFPRKSCQRRTPRMN